MIASIAALTLLAAILFPLFSQHYCGAKSLRDATQLSQIHAATLIFVTDNKMRFPMPGLIVPLPAAADGSVTEDYSLNHSAALYSMLIAQNMFGPELLCGPTEINPAIICKSDYNYDAYNPTAKVYWDPTFVMRLDDPAIGANASYAHIALCGDRVERLATASNPAMPVFGTRGVRGGVGPGNPDYDRSLTLQLHGSPKSWEGNICFTDNHVEMLNTFQPKGLLYDDGGGPRSDNIFAAEFAHPNGPQAAGDTFLCISTQATRFTVKDVYDTDALPAK